jgi:cell division protein ZapE
MNPLQSYKEKLSKGLIDFDEAQDKAAMTLMRLYDDVLRIHNPSPSLLHSLKQKILKPHALQGVYLYGPVGRGKSMLMDLFYQSIPVGIKKRRVHFHAFMIEVHEFIFDYQKSQVVKEGMEQNLPALAKVIANRSKVLCFDEFHVTDVADAMILGRLFTALWNEGIAIVATSNWAPDDLYKGGLQRELFLPFIETLKRNMDVYQLDGLIDYRARTLKELSVYFTPLGALSQQRADKVFRALTEEAEPAEDLISIKGRTIQVSETAKGVARFSFSQLCERPLGAEDYIAIAKRYNTIFLENIPRMGYDRRNEAKRFMTFVDVLYEHHRNLVITAEEPPESLYHGQDHAFEFQRTISRLLEMQSQNYIYKDQKAGV